MLSGPSVTGVPSAAAGPHTAGPRIGTGWPADTYRTLVLSTCVSDVCSTVGSVWGCPGETQSQPLARAHPRVFPDLRGSVILVTVSWGS